MLAAVALLALLIGFSLGLIAGVHWKGKVDDERLSGFLTELEATADRVAVQTREDAIERAGRY
nr:hypothetical protein [uncultured Actinomyces sp.]